ncbi:MULTISPECIES: hypothetical protein [Halocynthiibacter]|uniref:Uncharacterized protein n=1 Tax=Halocynthiibacter halioticoli TaxID=2986804 RepID=A0AAE3J336_9RHOB|nr:MULTISPECIES: hypothetical protein [Halocynthiibacter]MCV6826026.1 hypothetical protein [Halocynthiibacter halioticoli]MCW4059027.1 hypothetical protein [Halocynthiibacter sp. SDUM655004]
MNIPRPVNDNTFDFLRAASVPAHQLASEDCYSVHSRDGVGDPATPETSGGVNTPLPPRSLGGFDWTKHKREVQRQKFTEMLFGVLVFAGGFLIAALLAMLLGTIATKAIGQAAFDATRAFEVYQ